MNIGDLRRRITLQQRQTEKDLEGNVKATWTDYATVWAAFEDVSRWKEYFQDAASNAETYVRFKIRYRKDVTTEMRVVYEGVPYTVLNVSDFNGLHRETHLICKRVTTLG